MEEATLTAEDVALDQLLIVVAPTHPWAVTPPADVAALVAEGEWVLREPGSGTRSVFEEALREAGADPALLQLALELPSNESVRGAVEAGMGATATSASVAVSSLEAGLLHHVPFALPPRPFQVLWHRERRGSRAAAALRAMLRPRPAGGSTPG